MGPAAACGSSKTKIVQFEEATAKAQGGVSNFSHDDKAECIAGSIVEVVVVKVFMFERRSL